MMDELSAFERRLIAGLEAYAGPRRLVDARGIARGAEGGVTARPARWEWLTTTVGSWLDVGRPVRALVAVALVLAVVGTIAVGGAGLVSIMTKRDAPGPVPPAASASPTSGPNASAAPPPSTIPAPSASVPEGDGAVPGIPIDFTKSQASTIWLTSDAIGWITSEHGLYRTTDGGRTWRSANLPELSPYQDIQVVDDTTAVVAWAPPPGGTGIIEITRDGGRTWTRSTVAAWPSAGPMSVSVHSPTAWTMTAFDADPALTHVWSTTDAGVTWTGPVTASLPLPDFGGAMGNGVLWREAGKVDGVPFDNTLLLSFDGGLTWPRRTFPTTGFVKPGELKWLAGPPVIDASGRLAIVISNGDREGLYRSDDNGRTWQPGTTWKIRVSPEMRFDPLSAEDWVLWSGTDIYSTVDAGAHWRHVVPAQTLTTYTDFVSVDHAWVVGGSPGSLILLETTDGGESWHPVGR